MDREKLKTKISCGSTTTFLMQSIILSSEKEMMEKGEEKGKNMDCKKNTENNGKLSENY